MFTQTAIGIGVLATAGSLAVKMVLAPFAPAPLTINSIAYSAGIVTQDRTIVADGAAFYASWAASVIDTETGQAVPWCSGSGAFGYAVGRKEVAFTLAEWTGADGCTPASLDPEREYILRGTWQWGADQTSHESARFTP